MTIATRLRRVTPLAHGSGALGLYAVASSGAISVVLGVTSWLSLRHLRALQKFRTGFGHNPGESR